MPPRPVLRRPDGPSVPPFRHPDLDGRDEPDQHPVTSIEGLFEWLADHIAAGTNVTVTEADGVLTIAASGGGGGVTVHNDLTGRTAADAHPTSAVTGLDTALAGKAATVHSHATSDVTGLDEQVRDVVGTALVAGSNVSITVDDPADTITIAAAGAVSSVNGETGVVVLDAADVGALDASSGYNTANGWLKLDGSGTAPDSTIPASIARDSEVTSAVSAHAAATDPHGDRAYAAGLVDDLSGVTNASTARSNLGLGNVDNTSDANKPVSTAQQTALDGKAAASHSHSGADITSGTVSTARLGTGAANATTFLRGDQTWAAAGGSETLPASIIDAKGDLIVGTAADTAARLGVGSNGQVLTADSGEASGVKWATPGRLWVSRVAGEWYSMDGPTTTGVLGGTMWTARLTAIPVELHAGSLDRIGVYTTVAGSGTTWRLGIYPADASTGLPDGQARILDAGTVDMGATAGLLSITISQSLSADGLYWLVVLCDAYASNPTVHAWGFTAIQVPVLRGRPTSFALNPERSGWCRTAAGVTTGAIPSTCPSMNWHDSAPKIAVRAA